MIHFTATIVGNAKKTSLQITFAVPTQKNVLANFTLDNKIFIQIVFAL